MYLSDFLQCLPKGKFSEELQKQRLSWVLELYFLFCILIPLLFSALGDPSVELVSS